jgi:hypothetical protein
MSASNSPQEGHSGKRRPPPFRPRFTIGIFYLALFFFLFSFLQILPDLIVLLELAPGPEQQNAATEAARQGSSPLASALLALLATSVGSYYQILPGMKVG